MLDFIPKGTGNSRILKSVSNFASLYPTYADFIAALAAAGIPIDLAGVNSAGYNQLGTPLNVANLLSPEAVSALKIKTLDPTVNDAFLTIANQWASRNDFAKALVLSIADGLNDSNVPDMVCNRVLDRLATNDNVSGDWNYSSGKISVSSGNSSYYFDVYTVITVTPYSEDPNWTGSEPRQEAYSGSLSITGAPTYSFDPSTGKYSIDSTTVDSPSLNYDAEDPNGYIRYDISNGGQTLVEYHLYNYEDWAVFIDTRTKGSIAGTPTYSKGNYIQTITAGQNDYPVDGKQGDYWYVRGGQAPGINTATAELGPFSLTENCDRAVPYFAESKSGNVSVSYQISFNNGVDWNDAKNGKMVSGQFGDQLLLRAIAKFDGVGSVDINGYGCACMEVDE